MDTTLRTMLAGKSRKVLAVRPKDSVREAVQIMVSHNAGCVMVMDEEGLKGLFSERDLMRRVVLEGLDPERVAVGNAMTEEPLTADPDMTVSEAMRFCTENGIRHLPVKDGQELLALVSTGDLIQVMVRDRLHHDDDLITYIYGGSTV